MAAPILVLLFGPPATGKMTVGRALERATGFPLFHNHMSIELVLPFFDFGTPPFGRLVGGFREQLFEEVAASEHAGMIFTYVWAFSEPADEQFVERVKSRFEKHGGRVVFVELWADLETRLHRNATPERLAEKPSKRDVADSNRRLLGLEAKYRMTSDGDFPFDDYLWLDISDIEPEEAAARIVETFALPRRAPIAD
jgi:hypothetical protein